MSIETSERKLPLPVGKSDWEEVAAHCYCVDKTLLIRDLLAVRTGVALFTRPRRFDKTLVDSVCSEIPESVAKSLRKVLDKGEAHVCYNRYPSCMGIGTRDSDTFTRLVHSGLLTVCGENVNGIGSVCFPNREITLLWRSALEARR